VFDGLQSERSDQPLEEPSEHSDAVFEWKCAIIKILFDYPKKSLRPPVVHILLELCPSKQIELIHLLGLLLEKTVSSQSRSSLVRGKHPTATSINEMYTKSYIHGFQLSTADIEYLLELFNQKLVEFKRRCAEILSTYNLESIGK